MSPIKVNHHTRRQPARREAISTVRCGQRYSRDVARRHDFLDEIVDARSGRSPEFPELAEAALRRRQLLRELATRREKLGLSQTVVAARMGTSQSAVARFEAGEIDAKFSTIERFAAALVHKVEWRLTKARRSAAASSYQSHDAFERLH
jgi:ribosome-binding protein aMBF1 (putative translation factor)